MIIKNVSSNIADNLWCRNAIEKLTCLRRKAYKIYDAGKHNNHRQKYVIIT